MIYSLEAIAKHYSTRQGMVIALNSLTFRVQAGERLAMIGKSGSGKTTLFRLLNATLRPSVGSLHFKGQDVGDISGRDLRAMRRSIGTVYQQHQLVPSLSALDNALCGRLGRWSLLHTVRSALRPTRLETEEALHALESVGLADKRQARADELSGGQQQRLAIARVLMQDPEIILADEPVASLDPALSEAIISLLVRLANERGRTLIIALHDVALALRHFPRVIALHDGRVMFDAPSTSVHGDALDALYVADEAKQTKESLRDAGAWRDPRCLC